MVSLTEEEAAALRERLRATPAAQPAEETIVVSVNASTSITFTETEDPCPCMRMFWRPRGSCSGEALFIAKLRRK
jgi:hypothetical protein